MRIVAGKHRGRTLDAPKGRDTRPTSDRAREAMFNVLEHGVDGPGLRGARVIDVFAGTGALGLEALSRGARHATFVEAHRAAQTILRANIAKLHEEDATAVLPIKAAALPTADTPVDYAFLDAPYNKGLSVPTLQALADQTWLHAGSIIMVEVGADEVFTPPRGFKVEKDKSYGAARIIFISYSPELFHKTNM